MTNIHPSAVVYPGAVIGEGCEVGPFSVIGPRVVLGPDNWIGPHVVIEGNTKVGARNKFFQFSSVGSAPQDLKYSGEDSRLEIGDENAVREYVTLQPGTLGGGMLTKIGSRNLFMACSHVGHDGFIGDNCVLANSCALAGHVLVGDHVTIGGMAGIHQFTRLGDLSILGAGSMASEDVPPFCMAQGDRARLIGLNKVGLKRAQVSSDEIALLQRIFRALFLASGKFQDKLITAEELVGTSTLGRRFLDFMKADSKRGFIAARSRGEGESANE